MKLQSEWVSRGYFTVKDPEGGEPLTKLVRTSIARALGRDSDEIHVAAFPVGPAWRYALWWREGNDDYAEVQFFAGLSQEHPILSAGISVEKGLEGAAATKARPTQSLDRATWDWPRFVERVEHLLEKDVPECSHRLGRSLVVRFRASGRGTESEGQRETRAYLYEGGAWFQRHKGIATVSDICDHVRELDSREDWWVNTHLCCDLTAAEVSNMNSDDLSEMLLAFAPIRAAIRNTSSALSV